MITQGTDGLLNRDLDMGVMWGVPMLDFVPHHLGALDHLMGILPWMSNVSMVPWPNPPPSHAHGVVYCWPWHDTWLHKH
jgi:hypothetical protein